MIVDSQSRRRLQSALNMNMLQRQRLDRAEARANNLREFSLTIDVRGH
jgi:hypothetical protein